MNTPTIEIVSEEVYYPSMVRRFQGMFIDTLVIIMAMYLISAITSNWPTMPDWLRIGLFVALWTAYEPFFTAFSEGTVGNRLVGLRVRQYNNPQKRLNIVQAYVRFVLKFLLGWISFLTMHANPQRRTIHDLASGSVVNYKRFIK